MWVTMTKGRDWLNCEGNFAVQSEATWLFQLQYDETKNLLTQWFPLFVKVKTGFVKKKCQWTENYWQTGETGGVRPEQRGARTSAASPATKHAFTFEPCDPRPLMNSEGWWPSGSPTRVRPWSRESSPEGRNTLHDLKYDPKIQECV